MGVAAGGRSAGVGSSETTGRAAARTYLRAVCTLIPARAAAIRAGMVHINGAGSDQTMPFGGFKQSGNGREWGVEGIHEFLETKSVFGYATA